MQPALPCRFHVHRKIRGLGVGWWWWCWNKGREDIEGGRRGGGWKGHGRLWLRKGRAVVGRYLRPWEHLDGLRVHV